MTAKTESTYRRKSKRLEDNPEIAELYRRIGDRIRFHREQMGVRTQTEACLQVFGTSRMQSMWSRWERGLRLPNIGTLHRIAVWAGTTIGDLGLYEPPPGLTAGELRQIRAAAEKIVRLVEEAERRAEETRL